MQKKLLIVTGSINTKESVAGFIEGFEKFVSKKEIVIHAHTAIGELVDEMKERYDAIIIDGGLYAMRDDYDEMGRVKHALDMPTDFYCFRKDLNFPGMPFIGATPAEFRGFLKTFF